MATPAWALSRHGSGQRPTPQSSKRGTSACVRHTRSSSRGRPRSARSGRRREAMRVGKEEGREVAIVSLSSPSCLQHSSAALTPHSSRVPSAFPHSHTLSASVCASVTTLLRQKRATTSLSCSAKEVGVWVFAMRVVTSSRGRNDTNHLGEVSIYEKDMLEASFRGK
eukprot:1727671-Rhodomonas_salina.1